MSRRKHSGPLKRPGDSPAMTEAISWFLDRGLAVKRVSLVQLKYRDLNYYPNSGAMNRDQSPRMSGVGLLALAEVIDEMEGPKEANVVRIDFG
jgi:hypothetical protein